MGLNVMPQADIIVLVLGWSALFAFGLASLAFDALFAKIGVRTVRLLSLGRIRMDPSCGSESVLATTFGFIFAVLIILGICHLFQSP